jgi:tetratricopeptide (TPR) repeat protein
MEATCPDAKYRDGKKAVDDGKRACELTAWRDAHALDTLAAAYAEAGDFQNAVKWQEKAVALYPASSKSELRSRLDLYKAHKPYRDAAKKK